MSEKEKCQNVRKRKSLPGTDTGVSPVKARRRWGRARQWGEDVARQWGIRGEGTAGVHSLGTPEFLREGRSLEGSSRRHGGKALKDPKGTKVGPLTARTQFPTLQSKPEPRCLGQRWRGSGGVATHNPLPPVPRLPATITASSV